MTANRIAVASRGTRGRPRRAGRWAWVLFPVAATVFVAAVVTEKNLPVVLPLVTILWIASVFYGSVRSGASTAVIEIGTVYAAVVTLYAVLPLVAFLAIGMQYAITNDIRLYAFQPRPSEVGAVGWLYVLHLLSFGLAYRAVRGQLRFRPEGLRAPGRTRTVALVLLLGLVVGYFWVLNLVFDLSASSYAESYLKYARLPLLVAQVTNHLGGIRRTVEVALLVALFANFRRYRVLIAAALLAELVVTFVRLGSRTEFVLLSFGAAFLYHWMVRPIRERGLVLATVVLVGLFQLAGNLRGRMLIDRDDSLFRSFAYTNEFEALFANAQDLRRFKQDHQIGPIPASFVLTDVFALLPQQLSPVDKMNPADWYVNRFYPDSAAVGVAFAFGAIPESIVFGGWPGIILRGAGLGLLLALVHRWCAGQRGAFWPFVIYLWATLEVYQAFRATTFCLVPYFVYRVPLVILFVEAVHRLAGTKSAKALAARPGEAAAPS